ncbi:protein phosphatase 1 regulatory subunit 21-like [Amphiura filiformis]|uniref:protein phosphatase 1 regulatory subunit 21-like n=1 Tax=Amphiura filiformis TaxID=82378 RepID=UPI003B21F183
MADIQTKYQKLAQEYAKLRAQNQVLKKAVVDEQGKQTEIKDSVRERDQRIRKFEQEIDSLSFRNQQLTKRVNVLQEELDNVDIKGKKTKNDQGTASSSPSSVIGEELKNKIEENAKLHKQVYESSEEHRLLVQQLQDRLDNLERENNQHQSVLEATKTRHKDIVERLQHDKAKLEVKLQSQEKNASDSVHKAEHYQDELDKIQQDLGVKLAWAMKIINDKLAFNDTEVRELNALNVPTHDKKHQLKTKEVMGQAMTMVSELCAGLSNFHTYTEQRSKIFPVDSSMGSISSTNQKFCSYLHENASYLRPLDQAFKTFHESIKEEALTTLETATDLQDFSAKFSKYVAYLNKLEPYQLLSLEEECQQSSCSHTLEVRNMELHATYKKFTASFNKLDTYIGLLAAASTKSCDHLQTNHRAFFDKLAECSQSLYEVMKDLSKNYNYKVSLEHQLPTATQKLRTTDECVVSSLISLVTCTGKIANFAKANVEFFAAPAAYRTRGHSFMAGDQEGPLTSPAVTQFRSKAIGYMNSLSRSCPDSVPYEKAVRNQHVLLSSTMSQEGLSQQVANNSEKITRLEQEKEHWLLEAQLMQIKYDKEIQRASQLEEELQRVRNSGGKASSPSQETMVREAMANAVPETVPTSSGKKAATQIDTSMLGQLEGIPMEFGESDQTSRENLIKDHYTARLAEVTSQRQVTDGKAVKFSAECRALQKRLTLAEKAKDKQLEELQTAHQTITQLKDELQTTTRSYEGQLSMMSEHLCGMNDKLTKQKDEIDALKLSIKQPSKKPFKK